MGEAFVAATQYGDLKGTVSADGYDGSFLLELIPKASMPSGYRPVGLTCYVEGPRAGQEECFIHFSLAAVPVKRPEKWDLSIILSEAKKVGELEVHTFDLDVTVEEVLTLIKRLDLKVIEKSFRGLTITEHQGEVPESSDSEA